MTTAIIDLLTAELPELHAARAEDLASKIKALLEAQPCVKCARGKKTRK